MTSSRPSAFSQILRRLRGRGAGVAAAGSVCGDTTRPGRDSAAGREPVKPNIMFTLDDSGSMVRRLPAGLRRRITFRPHGVPLCRRSPSSDDRSPILVSAPPATTVACALAIRRIASSDSIDSLLQPHSHLTSRQEEPTAPTFPVQATDTSAVRGSVDQRLRRRLRGLSRRQQRRNDQSRRPAIPTQRGATSSATLTAADLATALATARGAASTVVRMRLRI